MGVVVDFWHQLLVGRESFLPHSVCLTTGPTLWLTAISDGLIAASYYSIPLAVTYFAWNRKDLTFRWVFLMFGLFVLACGTTHVFHVWLLFQPDYLAAASVNLFTAGISLATAAALWPLMRRALALPSPAQLAGVNVALSRAVAGRQAAEAVIRSTNLDLERRVEQRTAALAAANENLRQEIGLRAAVETQLRQAKEEAEQANRGKSRFLAAASHDLRQPVQAMFHFTQALSRRLPDDQSKRVLADLDRSLTALKGQLDGLLDASKLDAGVVVPACRRVAVGDLLDRAAAEFSPCTRQKGVRLIVVKSTAVVDSDPALLGRILQNLVANAVRYTNQGRILVGCRRRGGALSIEIHDTGIGIPAERLSDIFDEFTQIENGERERGQGLGLGLSIVRRLCHLLGHEISVHSQVERGSVFYLRVPLADGASTNDVDAAAKD